MKFDDRLQLEAEKAIDKALHDSGEPSHIAKRVLRRVVPAIIDHEGRYWQIVRDGDFEEHDEKAMRLVQVICEDNTKFNEWADLMHEAAEVMEKQMLQLREFRAGYTALADEVAARKDSMSDPNSIQWNGAIACAEGIIRGKAKE